MDDPLLGGQVGEEGSNTAQGHNFDPTETSLDRTENEENETVTSLLDVDDDDCLIIYENGGKHASTRPLKPDESIDDKGEDDGELKDKRDEENPSENISGDEKDGKDDEDSEPKIWLKMDGIFEQQEEVDGDGEQLMDVQSMMQMNFQEDEQDTSSPKRTSKKPEVEPTDDATSTRRHLPRRAAATAAAQTIREISNIENDEEIEEITSRRGRKEYDKTFRVSDHIPALSENKESIHKCGVCKKYAPCPIKILQFGTDVHLCSTSCFNIKRYPISNGTKRRLACVKCSLSNQAGTEAFYWETMNFCSDFCVGSYQVEVGGKCATCYKKILWIKLGKYCVRFGSDIRQFCTGGCLESYKNNARVCFHCQLDIKQLGNGILANISSKASPKEFCSQDCMEKEMYVEQNLNQTVKSRASQQSTCVMCSDYRLIFRELILPSAKGLKVCSLMCWNKMIEAKDFTKPVKCEKCAKYINLESEFEPPAHYVATEEKMYCFCSATCKNVFVLNKRQILSCTGCKVNKYNYDLVQYFNNQVFVYAVCSLNCLPKSVDYINTLRSNLLPPTSASEMVSRNGTKAVFTEDVDSGSFPIINSNSVTSIPPEPESTANQFDSTGGLTGLVQSHLQSTASSIVVSNTMTMGTFSLPEGYETCTVSSPTGVDFLQPSGDYTLSDESRWDGVLRDTDVADILDLLKPPAEMKTKFTMAKPKNKVVETQTDISELASMERVPLKTIEKIRYVPFPIPYPVYLPTPTYFAETPVPYPFAIPIPIPIPIPVIFDGVSGALHSGASPWASNPSDQEKDTQSDNLNVPPANGSSTIDSSKSNDIEIMDCADPCSQFADDSAQNLDSSPLSSLTTTFTNTISQANPGSTLAVSTSSAAIIGSSASQLLTGNVSEVASSPEEVGEN